MFGWRIAKIRLEMLLGGHSSGRRLHPLPEWKSHWLPGDDHYAREKFKRCRDMHLLSELTFKSLDWQELEDIVARIPTGDESQLGDFKELFEFRFKSFST